MKKFLRRFSYVKDLEAQVEHLMKVIEGDVEELHYDRGNFEAILKGPAMSVFAGQMALIFEDPRCPNFVTVEAYHPIVGKMYLTIGKCAGKTPAEKIHELEDRIKELEKMLKDVPVEFEPEEEDEG
jgi:hypothetical protein